MKSFAKLQAQHEALLAKVDTNQNKAALAKSAQRYIENISIASTSIESQQQRDQLRVILRFWAAFIFEHTGSYPASNLRPFTGGAGSKNSSGKNITIISTTELQKNFRTMKRTQKMIIGGLLVIILFEWAGFILLIANF